MASVKKTKGIKDPFSITPSEMKWRDKASCLGKGVDPFFVTPKSQYIAKAIAVCKSCPVRSECFYEAMSYGYDGIWGGSTYDQRLVLVKTLLNSDLTEFNYSKSNNLLPIVDKIGRTKETAMADIYNDYTEVKF